MKKPKGFIDVNAEIQQKKLESQANKEFFQYLDNQHLTFKVFTLAVMGHYQCDAHKAGVLIAKHLKGEY